MAARIPRRLWCPGGSRRRPRREPPGHQRRLGILAAMMSSPPSSPPSSPSPTRYPRILIIGGGYVGMYTALRLQCKLRAGEARVTVVDPQSYMTYQPFLPEAAAGNLEPRHAAC